MARPAKKQLPKSAPVPPHFVKRLWEKMPQLIETHQKTTALRDDYIARKEALHHLNNYHQILGHITSHMTPAALREREGRRASEYAQLAYTKVYGRPVPPQALPL